MKILSIVPIPRRVESALSFGGAERRFFEIAKRWAKSGNEIQIVGSEFAYNLSKEFGLLTKTHTYKPSFARGGMNDFINVRKVIKKIPLENFDFIYCPMGELFLPMTVSALAKAKLKIPLVVSVNLFESHEIGPFPLLQKAFFPVYDHHRPSSPRDFWRAFVSIIKGYTRNLFMKRSDLIFSVSSYTKRLLEKMRVDGKRIFPVGGGIDHDAIRSINSQSKVYDACFLGAIHARKGVSDLVYLWKTVTSRKPEMKLVIIGSESAIYADRIKELIRKFDLEDNIVMPGFVNTKKKYELLKSSKIFIFPSYAEGFAQTICEAMACGLPVVAYDLPVYKEWYGNDILYAKKGNVKELIRTTVTLLEDDALQRTMMERGLKRSRTYNWDNIAEYEMEIIAHKLF